MEKQVVHSPPPHSTPHFFTNYVTGGPSLGASFFLGVILNTSPVFAHSSPNPSDVTIATWLYRRSPWDTERPPMPEVTQPTGGRAGLSESRTPTPDPQPTLSAAPAAAAA